MLANDKDTGTLETRLSTIVSMHDPLSMDPTARRLHAKLISRCAEDLEAMRRALGERRLEVVRELGHRMAGACGSFGVESISEVGRDLQRAAESGDAASVSTALDRLARELDAQGRPERGPRLRVLLLEDDPLQLELAASWLREAGYDVVDASTGRDAMRILADGTVDLAIFDWMLPDITGDEVLQWLRERQRRMPVMFATSRDEEAEVSSMLELGADDYVAKPLRRREFVARVAALARRAGLAHEPEDQWLQLGPYRINRTARTISLSGRGVKLTPRMMEVALLLFRKHGELVTRKQLYEQVWGHREALDTRSVDTHVSRLRQALELDGRHGWRLAAVYQHGYRLESMPADPGPA